MLSTQTCNPRGFEPTFDFSEAEVFRHNEGTYFGISEYACFIRAITHIFEYKQTLCKFDVWLSSPKHMILCFTLIPSISPPQGREVPE